MSLANNTGCFACYIVSRVKTLRRHRQSQAVAGYSHIGKHINIWKCLGRQRETGTELRGALVDIISQCGSQCAPVWKQKSVANQELAACVINLCLGMSVSPTVPYVRLCQEGTTSTSGCDTF